MVSDSMNEYTQEVIPFTKAVAQDNHNPHLNSMPVLRLSQDKSHLTRHGTDMPKMLLKTCNSLPGTAGWEETEGMGRGEQKLSPVAPFKTK